MRITLFLISLLMSCALAAQEVKGTQDPDSQDNRGGGGPDAFGYTFLDSDDAGGPTFAFQDISATGASVALADDAEAGPIALGFDFSFYGNTQTSIFVESNGFLSFLGGEGGDFTNDCPLAAGTSPDDAIFPYWDDLDPGDDGALLYTQTFAACPYAAPGASGQCFIAQWEEFDFFPGDGVPGGTAGTFQAILFESGHVVFQFDTGFSGDGGSSTNAISNDAMGNSLLYQCNTAASIDEEFAILFSPPESDLQLTITPNATPPTEIGDTFAFDIAVENLGPGDNSGVAVVGDLTDGLAFVSSDCGATEMGGTITWNIGALTNGTIAGCSVSVMALLSGDQSLTATATGGVPDPDPVNNTDIVGTVLVAPPQVPALNTTMLILLGMLLLGVAGWTLTRRRNS